MIRSLVSPPQKGTRNITTARHGTQTQRSNYTLERGGRAKKDNIKGRQNITGASQTANKSRSYSRNLGHSPQKKFTQTPTESHARSTHTPKNIMLSIFACLMYQICLLSHVYHENYLFLLLPRLYPSHSLPIPPNELSLTDRVPPSPLKCTCNIAARFARHNTSFSPKEIINRGAYFYFALQYKVFLPKVSLTGENLGNNPPLPPPLRPVPFPAALALMPPVFAALSSRVGDTNTPPPGSKPRLFPDVLVNTPSISMPFSHRPLPAAVPVAA